MLNDFVAHANSSKRLFTAGPSSLTEESLEYIQPCFGRGDSTYSSIESKVLNLIREFTCHDNIVRLQGSATLALEVGLSNFCYGDIVVLSTGYYSERLFNILSLLKTHSSKITSLTKIDYNDFLSFSGRCDWLVSVNTETSIGFKVDVPNIRQHCDKLQSRLFLDSTASIGLETDDSYSDVSCFSSCKGLFGLTGSSFLTYSSNLDISEPNYSHYLRLSTHINKGVTGPYHTILSLYGTLLNYDALSSRVKRFRDIFVDIFSEYLLYPDVNQPVLCTALSVPIHYNDPSSIIYTPRSDKVPTVVCHIGHVHVPCEDISNSLVSSLFTVL